MGDFTETTSMIQKISDIKCPSLQHTVISKHKQWEFKIHNATSLRLKTSVQSGGCRSDSKHTVNHVIAAVTGRKVYLKILGDYGFCLVFPSQATGALEACNYGRTAGDFQNLTLPRMQFMHLSCVR